MARILQRVDDPELRGMLQGAKGGEFARAIASEFDMLHTMVASQGQGRPPALITDMEAQALEQWMRQHFSLTGRPPDPSERLVSRVMMTLHGLFQQLQDQQRKLAPPEHPSTPVR